MKLKKKLIIWLCIFCNSLLGQQSFTGNRFGLEADRTRFTLSITQDSLIRSSLSYYNSGLGGGTYKVLAFNENLNVIENNWPPDLDGYQANEIRFLPSQGYFILSDTNRSGHNGYPQDRVLDFISYKGQNPIWRTKGWLRILGLERGAIAKTSNAVWLLDYRKQHFVNLNLSSGDTILILPFEALTSQFGSFEKDIFPVNLELNSLNSDTAMFSILYQKKDSLSTPKIDYGLLIGELNLDSLSLISYTCEKQWWNAQFSVGLMGYFLSVDSFGADNSFSRKIFEMSLQGDTIKEFPTIRRQLSMDSIIQPRRSTFYRMLKRNDKYFYIESFKDSSWNSNHLINHLRVISIHGDSIVYDLVLKDSLFNRYNDLNYTDAVISTSDQLILSVNCNYDGKQGRIVGFSKEGYNYFHKPALNTRFTEIAVYPTITRDLINLEAPTEIQSLQILDLRGQLLINLNPNASSTVVDIEGLKPGLLFLHIKLKGVWENIRIMKI